MTRDEARESAKRDREMAEIKEAWASGKTIEYSNIANNDWYTWNGDSFQNVHYYKYRIAKEKTFRPFKDYEEFKPYRERWAIFHGKPVPAWYAFYMSNFEWCFHNAKFEDGSVFGIEE